MEKKLSSNILKNLTLLYPLTFVLGNLAINLLTFLIIIVGLISFKKEIFHFKDKKVILFFGLFFLIVLFSTMFEVIINGYYSDWTKALLYLRFFLLMIVIKELIRSNILKLNNFLFLCFIVSGLVALDLMIQFIFGKNLIGFEPIYLNADTVYFTGIFKKELVAGGFIFMFSILGIFALPLIFKNMNKIYLLLIFITVISIYFASILLSGNRMPMIMFLIFLILLSIFVKKNQYRNLFYGVSLILLIISLISIFNSDTLKKRYGSFYEGIPNPVNLIKLLQINYPELEKFKGSGKQFIHLPINKSEKKYELIPFYTGHSPIYLTSLDLFLDNTIIGKGIKSYRNNCKNKVHLPNRVCESHPHNFILEILNDTGIIGLMTILIPVLLLLINLYKEYLLGEDRKNNISNWIYLSIIMCLVTHFFPFKSTGSFFSTFNSTYIFLIIGFSLGLNEIKLKNINK